VLLAVVADIPAAPSLADPLRLALSLRPAPGSRVLPGVRWIAMAASFQPAHSFIGEQSSNTL